MRKRHYPLRLGVLVLIMLDTFRRSFLEHDAFDQAMFVFELLVLVLIAFEGLVHLWSHAKRASRIRRLRPYQMRGFALLEEYQSKYRNDTTSDGKVEWLTNVDAWEHSTVVRLQKYSADAAHAFMRDSSGVVAKWGGNPNQSVHGKYAWLQTYLNNLHEIIQNADAYL